MNIDPDGPSRHPERIGPYPVIRAIARGGMAEVYEVRDEWTEERLALKLLTQLGLALPRFHREYEAMVRLNHPNVVRVYGYGQHGEFPWLSMELVSGTQVQAYIKRQGRAGQPQRTREALRVAHEVALALDHLHQRGLVHRDLKSANVLVLPDGRVKLIDFGTARVRDGKAITAKGEFLGTFAYASPEQLVGAPDLDGRSDLYSLGVLLYRLLTAKRPFDAEDPQELARLHFRGRYEPASRVVRALPVELDALLARLIHPKREERFPTGRAVADALRQVLGDEHLQPSSLDVDSSAERALGREGPLREVETALRFPPPAFRLLLIGPEGSGRGRFLETLRGRAAEFGARALMVRFQPGDDPLRALALALEGQVGRPRAEPPLPDSVRAALQAGRDPALGPAERLALVVRGLKRWLRHAPSPEGEAVPEPTTWILASGLEYGQMPALRVLEAAQRALGTADGRPALVVATANEGADAQTGLLQREWPDAARIHLPSLDPAGAGRLVGALLHRRPPPASLARRVHAATGGLPAFIEDLVRRLVDDGLLRTSGPFDRLEWAARQEDLDLPLPAAARAALGHALDALPREARRVLEALCLDQGPTPIARLARLLGCSPRELVPSLTDLKQSGWIVLIRRDGRASARLHRPLIAALVEESLRPTRRRVLEQRLLAEIEQEEPSAAQIRLLFQEERWAEAAQQLTLWAAHHLAGQRPETALSGLDPFAQALVEHEAVPERLRSQLALVDLNALMLARPLDPRTARQLEGARALATRQGPLFGAELLLIQASLQRLIGHTPNFRKLLAQAWELVADLPPSPLAATIADRQAWADRLAGDVQGAARWHGKARRLAHLTGYPVARALADVGVAGWQLARGRLAEAETTAGQALQALLAADHDRGVAEGVATWAHALREQGRFTEALEGLYRLHPRMRASELPTAYVQVLLATAWCELDLARLGRAQEWIDELAATVRRGELLDLRLESDLLRGRIALESGRWEEALNALEGVYQRSRASGAEVLACRAKALAAEATALSGHAAAAQALFEEACRAAQRTGDTLATAVVCVGAARSLATQTDPDLWMLPVRDFLEGEPRPCLWLGWTLARAQHPARAGDGQAARDAQAWLDDLTSRQGDTERQALALHPWARQLRALFPPPEVTE